MFKKRNVNEALIQITALQVVKLAAGPSIKILEINVKTLWRSRPPPKDTSDYPQMKSQRCRNAGLCQRFCPHRLEKKMMVAHLDRFTPYQGTTQDEWS